MRLATIKLKGAEVAGIVLEKGVLPLAALNAAKGTVWKEEMYELICAQQIPALTQEGDEVKEMVKEYQRRRDYAVQAINDIDGISCLCPKGAFYIFINCKQLGKTSAELSQYFLEEAKIALVPGDVFGPGGEGYLRMSFAASYENIVEGCRRLAEAVAALNK